MSALNYKNALNHKNALNYKKLENDLQIIYEKPKSSIPISSIQLFCNIGNIHAPKELKGITHFIEHMCFKGTKQHPDFNNVLKQYSEYGIEYNGYSFQRYTVYVIKCQNNYLSKCIKLLANEVLDSIFNLTEFKREEKVVIEENIISNDNPRDTLETITNKLLYENTPYEYPTDSITYHNKPYNYADVLNFYKEHYIPPNMVFSITTTVAFPTIVSMVKNSLFNKKISEKIKTTPTVHSLLLPNLINTHPLINGIKYAIKHIAKLNTLYLQVSFQTCNQYNYKDKYRLNAISTILGGTGFNRLKTILRSNNGLVYGVYVSTNYTECGGDFIISSQFNTDSFIQKNKPSVLPLIIQELNHLIQSGITQSELNRVKNNIQGDIMLSLQNTDNQAHYNGACLLYQSPEEIVPYTDLYKTYYEPITRNELNACIRTYLSKMRMCVTVVGCEKKIPPLSSIKKECEKLKN